MTSCVESRCWVTWTDLVVEHLWIFLSKHHLTINHMLLSVLHLYKQWHDHAYMYIHYNYLAWYCRERGRDGGGRREREGGGERDRERGGGKERRETLLLWSLSLLVSCPDTTLKEGKGVWWIWTQSLSQGKEFECSNQIPDLAQSYDSLTAGMQEHQCLLYKF